VDERPVWRQLFDAWEKAVGPRLEEYVQTDEFAERMTAFQQMNRRTAEMNEEATRQFLRSWNLPTASDLERLSQQVAEIDRRLRALSQRVDEAVPAPGPRKRQGSKTAAGIKAAIESRQAAANRAEAATGGGVAIETEDPPSAAAAAIADSGTAGDSTVPDAGAGDRPGVTAKASASKAKASRRRASKATPAKASASAKSSAPAHNAESHGPRSGSRQRDTERDSGNNRDAKA
jgi:hypothetical protein